MHMEMRRPEQHIATDNRRAIRLAIEAAGGLRALARKVGVSPSTVGEWTKVGQIPAHRVLQLEAETGIPREELRPDLYRTKRKGGEEHVLTPRQLRAVRAWLGWTQRQIADEAQLSPTAIVDWENAVRTPRRATALALMHAMKRLRVRFDDQGNLILPR